MTWPNSGGGSYLVDYDYDMSGAMTAVRENGATSGAGVLATYAYDNLGRRTSIARGNGVTTTLGFDGVSRLASYAHDAAGTSHDQTYGFTYNPGSQILGQTSSNSAFNRTPGASFLYNYTVNGLNQYLTAAGAIEHDARGNLIDDGPKTYTYDFDNRLISVADGATGTLSYDPAGRLHQIAASATTKFLYDGAQAIAEYDGSNNLLRRYVPGAAVDETVVWLEGSGTSDRRWLLTDVRGSVVALTDDDGDADLDDAGPSGPAINKYDEYGTPAAGNTGRFQYTGQMWLPEIGVYHYKARAYHPGLGRFMQTDPIGYGDGMNLYAYVGNDPVNFTDPSGLTTEPAPNSCPDDYVCVTGSSPFGGGGAGGGGASGGGDGVGPGSGPRVPDGPISEDPNPIVVTAPRPRAIIGNFGGPIPTNTEPDEILVTATRLPPFAPRNTIRLLNIHLASTGQSDYQLQPPSVTCEQDPECRRQQQAYNRLLFFCNLGVVAGSVGAFVAIRGGATQVGFAGLGLFVVGYGIAFISCGTIGIPVSIETN